MLSRYLFQGPLYVMNEKDSVSFRKYNVIMHKSYYYAIRKN